ncbi:Ribokinase [Corynebacterium ciconiae DSM 44920]|uniref:ribokinase n=1 Tax=Corynebacterium ciconiae TaxID=227319 RepID=UPI0003648D65|nr:ribokinase [Corynebacterium ciconiae]WKD60643.1 Ribokinase [Corynebacterium ciconiae DSM 44920]
MSIAVVGSINADLTVTVQRQPAPGETLLGTSSTVSPGGKGANQAVAAARMGATVHMIGAVGTDSYAAPACAIMQQTGMGEEGISTVDGPTGLAVITVAEDGENSIVVVPGANAALSPEMVDAHEDLIAQSSILLLQGEIPATTIERAIELARHHEVRVVVNLAPVIEMDRQALLHADPLIANEHEAGLIAQHYNLDSQGSPEELAERLCAAGFASVVLTLGAQGALVATAAGIHRVPAATVQAVDTTGCGDACAGALVAALDSGAELVEATALGCRVGAFAATRAGAQTSYPSAEDTLPS